MIQFNSAKAAEPESVRQSIGHIVEDIIILGELQARLFQSDAREIMGQIMRPLVILAGGISLFLATVPVGLLAIADCLVAAGVPLAAAYGLVAVASLVVAAGMGDVGLAPVPKVASRVCPLAGRTASERVLDHGRRKRPGCQAGASTGRGYTLTS